MIIKNSHISFFLIFFCCLISANVISEMRPGEVIYKIDFNNKTERSKWIVEPFAKWVQRGNGSTFLMVDVSPSQGKKSNMIRMPLDKKQLCGTKLLFRCMAKAQNVTKPSYPYLGVKYMLYFKTKNGEFWENENNVYGTFDWKELYFLAEIPKDVDDAQLFLGLQGSSGKVWFDKLSVIILDPRSSENSKNQTHWRGVMSPIMFRDEDFRTLGIEWNANLIRWQLNRYLENPYLDRNLAEYDQWLNNKLIELDQVVSACSKYGINLVIDLHSPPGGRYKNGNTVMFFEKKYNDYFIKVWDKIAKRYKGNPIIWGYDLINEPVQAKSSPSGMGYLETQEKAAKAIREIDQNTSIIIEVNDHDAPNEFQSLTPLDISNVIYEAHMYLPVEYTHQGVVNKLVNITYPGIIARKLYNKETLRTILEPIRNFQLAYNAHIYIGEFSAIRWAPGAAQYLSDCIDIFEEYGWDWTYHSYREWPGWSVEYENGKSDKIAIKNPDRKNILLYWFQKNIKPKY